MKKIILGFVFFMCFALFDNYVKPPGLRIFDFVSFILILFFFKPNKKNKYNFIYFIFLFYTIFYTIPISIINLRSISFLPYIVGFIAYFILRENEILNTNLSKYVNYTLFVITTGILLQYLFFQITGKLPSLLILASDNELRSQFGNILIRPSGFFIEPGDHAFSAILLMTLHFTINKFKISKLLIYSTLGVVISFSFAGILILFLFWLLVFLKSNIKFIYKVFIISTILFFLVYLVNNDTDSNFYFTIINRFEAINSGKDSSTNDRIAGLFTNYCFNCLTDKWYFFLLGHGITSELFVKFCGSNNMAWLIYCYGIFIPLFFLSYLFKKYASFPFILLSFIYIIITAQISSYMIIWFYLLAIDIIYKNSIINEK